MIQKQQVDKKDLTCGLILILFSTIAFFHLQGLPVRAAIFPQIMLAGIFILATLLLLKSLGFWAGAKRRQEEVQGGAKAEEEKKDESRPENLTLSLTTLATIIIYIALIPILGFFLSTIGFIFGILFVLKMRRYFLMAFLAIMTSTIVFVVFKTVMYISLPGGIFDPTEYLYRLIG